MLPPKEGGAKGGNLDRGGYKKTKFNLDPVLKYIRVPG